MHKAANVYMQTKVSTTDQGQLLILLYDGALTFLAQARDKMIARDFAAKGLLISKAIDIVNELASSLNMERGGNLAENLNSLYFLCTARLLQANLKMNVEQLDSVVTILTSLRGAYAQIVDKPEAKQAVQQISARILPEVTNNQRVMTKSNQVAPGAMSQLQAKGAYQMANSMNLQQNTTPSASPATTVAPVAELQKDVEIAAANATINPVAQNTTPEALVANTSTVLNNIEQPRIAVKTAYPTQNKMPASNTENTTASIIEPAQNISPEQNANTDEAMKIEKVIPPLAATKTNFSKSLAAYGKLAM